MHYGPKVGSAFSGMLPGQPFSRFYHQKKHDVSGNLPTGAAMTLNLELAVATQQKDHEAVTGIIGGPQIMSSI